MIGVKIQKNFFRILQFIKTIQKSIVLRQKPTAATYYENPTSADCAIISLFGDDPNDYMAKCGAKWLHRNGVNVLCVSPGKKNYSHVNYPLERIESAIRWLKAHGNRKIGIMGMSTTAMVALAAASHSRSA